MHFSDQTGPPRAPPSISTRTSATPPTPSSNSKESGANTRPFIFGPGRFFSNMFLISPRGVFFAILQAKTKLRALALERVLVNLRAKKHLLFRPANSYNADSTPPPTPSSDSKESGANTRPFFFGQDSFFQKCFLIPLLAILRANKNCEFWPWGASSEIRVRKNGPFCFVPTTPLMPTLRRPQPRRAIRRKAAPTRTLFFLGPDRFFSKMFFNFL